MKLMFIPAKSKKNISFDNVKLKGKVGVVTTIQYLDSVKKLCKGNFVLGGQVLGCNFNSALKVKGKVDKFLYVGTGKFHVLGLALNTDKEVYVLNPLSGKFFKFDSKDVQKYKAKRKGALLKFLNAKKVGLLVSLKLGQYSPGKYLDLKNKLKLFDVIKKKYPDKNFYVYVFNTLRKEELENFDVDCWVNLACPRIVDDFNFVNYSEICK